VHSKSRLALFLIVCCAIASGCYLSSQTGDDAHAAISDAGPVADASDALAAEGAVLAACRAYCARTPCVAIEPVPLPTVASCTRECAGYYDGARVAGCSAEYLDTILCPGPHSTCAASEACVRAIERVSTCYAAAEPAATPP
jgi:hypothetical protein